MNELSFQKIFCIRSLILIVIVFTAASASAQAPSIISTMPPNGAFGVRPDLDAIYITFDKPVKWPDLIPPTKCVSISSNWGEPYIIKAPWHPENFMRIGRQGGDFAFIGKKDLPLGTLITLTLNSPGTSSDCFRDQEGNLLPPFHLSFTVRQNAGDPPLEPYVVSTNPPNGATGVSRDISSVSITFSKPMDISARSYIHRYGWGASAGRWSADRQTLTLTRADAGTLLPDGQDIVFVLSTLEYAPLKDEGGNALQEYTFSFTTEGNFEQWVENTYGVEIIRVPANPGKGFYWHYYLSIPKALSGSSVLYVAPNNTGWPAVDHTFHDIRARRTLYWETGNVYNWRLDAPVLVPTFPRYTGLYLQNLWLDPFSENNRIAELRRIDLQLIAMIEDAKERLLTMGRTLYDNVFMNGFSASGEFTARFSLIHPEEIRAAAFGGGISTLPVLEWQGREMRWPEGIADISRITGHPFDVSAYRYVPLFIFVGDRDGHFDPAGVEVARQVYNSVGADAEIKVYPGVGHHYTDEILSDLGSFFARHRGPRTTEFLSVIKTGSGGGTISSNPTGILCGSDCFETFDHGTQVILTATADIGSTFVGWSGSDCSGTGQCAVIMDSSKKVTAKFSPAGKPVISVTPKSVNFGSVKEGGISAPKMIIVNNTGPSELVVHRIEIRDWLTGEVSREFRQINNCNTAAIRKGDHPCGITVTFAPVLPFGKKNAVMRIESNDPKKPAIDVKLSGTASPPKISAAPKAVNFGPVGADTSSPPKTVSIKNTGISDLVINSISIESTHTSDFRQTDDCMEKPVSQGGSCTITITFRPSVPFGKKSAALNIFSNDPKKPVTTINLSGSAPPPKISVTPAKLNFGAVSVGSSSIQTVTVVNKGISNLVINSIDITGMDASDFNQTNSCMTAPIHTGGSCVINVEFTPPSMGKKLAIINITSNDPQKVTMSVNVSGNG